MSGRARRRRASILSLVPARLPNLSIGFLTVLLLACSSASDPAAPTAEPVVPMTIEQAAARGSYAVGVTTLQLVDESRPTAPNRDFAGASSRSFTVEVWYPAMAAADEAEVVDAPVDARAGPYPLIVFAHGFSAFRRQSASYAQHLASHGYVVASPDFPGTTLTAPGGARLYGLLDQPADVSFIIDALLVKSADGESPLGGTIEPEAIAMTGHSLGGLTAMLTAFGERADGRIDAILPISPPACFLPADFSEARHVPTMVVGGANEQIVSPSWIAYAYEIAPTPKYFVSIAGADHVRFADVDRTDAELPDIVDQLSGGERDADWDRIVEALEADGSKCQQRDEATGDLVSGERQRELLRTVALPFFDAYLKQDPAAEAFLENVLPTLPGITLQSDTHDVQSRSE